MKKRNVIIPAILVAALVISCKPESNPPEMVKTIVVDFEDVTLNASGKTDATFKSADFLFVRNGKNAWDGGFTASNHTDTTTVGYTNDNSAAAGKGAKNSEKYAVGYAALFTNGLDTIKFPTGGNGTYSAKSIMLTNGTYAYRGMKYGEYGAGATARKFAKGDWFKVTIIGFLNGQKNAEVDYYLADFREEKSFIAKEWNQVDISALGRVDQLVFTVSSSDNDPKYGMNTPAYFCMDNLELTQPLP